MFCLKDLIARLASEEPSRVILHGFARPHSYRGYYEQLAFEPCGKTTVGRMLAYAEEALDTTYTGWKGGEFTMNEYTECWISRAGECHDSAHICRRLLDYMLADVVASQQLIDVTLMPRDEDNDGGMYFALLIDNTIFALGNHGDIEAAADTAKSLAMSVVAFADEPAARAWHAALEQHLPPIKGDDDAGK